MSDFHPVPDPSGSRQPPNRRPPTAVGADLTPKQRELLRALAVTPSVSDAAVKLGVSRSNVYASLRRISSDDMP